MKISYRYHISIQQVHTTDILIQDYHTVKTAIETTEITNFLDERNSSFHGGEDTGASLSWMSFWYIVVANLRTGWGV
jgi:hypothetical protein